MVHGLIIHKTRSSEVCEHAQAIISAAASTGTQLTYFNADRLRSALRAAGNIVKPSEIPEVLSYVIRDSKYEDLHDLHLILLTDGSVQQIKWASPGSQTYFVFTDNKSKRIFDLMSSNKHQLVKHTQAWDDMSRYDCPAGLRQLLRRVPYSWQHSLHSRV